MAHAAAPVAALRDARRLPGWLVDPGADGLASDGRLESHRLARRHGALQYHAVSAANARGSQGAAAPVALLLSLLRGAYSGEHDHSGEGPAHLHPAYGHRLAQLRN